MPAKPRANQAGGVIFLEDLALDIHAAVSTLCHPAYQHFWASAKLVRITRLCKMCYRPTQNSHGEARRARTSLYTNKLLCSPWPQLSSWSTNKTKLKVQGWQHWLNAAAKWKDRSCLSPLSLCSESRDIRKRIAVLFTSPPPTASGISC